MKRKTLMTTVSAAVFVVTIVLPMILVTPVAAADPANWYKTVNGNLSSDTYTLYPYAATSLDVGFSKYGELINATGGNLGVGIQYPGFENVGTYDQKLGTSRDPFANELVSQRFWINGWLINITYRDKLLMEDPTKAYRNIWAFALFSDGLTVGGDWQTHVSTPTVGLGGRQTNRVAKTDDLRILYDGPRRFVAV